MQSTSFLFSGIIYGWAPMSIILKVGTPPPVLTHRRPYSSLTGHEHVPRAVRQQHDHCRRHWHLCGPERRVPLPPPAHPAQHQLLATRSRTKKQSISFLCVRRAVQARCPAEPQHMVCFSDDRLSVASTPLLRSPSGSRVSPSACCSTSSASSESPSILCQGQGSEPLQSQQHRSDPRPSTLHRRFMAVLAALIMCTGFYLFGCAQACMHTPAPAPLASIAGDADVPVHLQGPLSFSGQAESRAIITIGYSLIGCGGEA